MSSSAGYVRIAVGILGLTLIGGLFMAYLWETLNQLFSGHVDPLRLLISVPIAIGFILLLRYIARVVNRWDEHTHREHMREDAHD